MERILFPLLSTFFLQVHLAEDMDSGEKFAMKKIKLVEEREMGKVKWEVRRVSTVSNGYRLILSDRYASQIR